MNAHRADADYDDDWDDDYGDDIDDAELIPCPYCHEEIPEDAQRCPHCENYISEEDRPPQAKPLWFIIGFTLCMVIVIWWIVTIN